MTVLSDDDDEADNVVNFVEGAPTERETLQNNPTTNSGFIGGNNTIGAG